MSAECRHIWNLSEAVVQVALECHPVTLTKRHQEHEQVQATEQMVETLF